MNQDNQEKKVKTPANRRALKIGSLTVTTTAVVIIIAVLVNLVVAELPSNLTKFDASVSGLYTLSE